jgi:multiple sugar transport system permease protein
MRRTSFARNVAVYVLIVLVLAIFLIPIYTMIVMSFKGPNDVIQQPLLPFGSLTLDNYRTVLFGEQLPGAALVSGSGVSFAHALLNSLVVSVGSTLVALTAGVPAAYVLARRRFRGRRQLATFILSTRFAPPLAVLLPFYTLFTALHLVDTQLALIVVYITMNLSMVVWMMMGFVREVPRDLEEAAMVDGATQFGAFRRVTLPLVAGGLAATAIFVMFLAWNEFLMAVILTNNNAVTAPVAALAYIRYMYVAWGPLTAAGTIIAVPVLLFALVFQQRLVRGLTAGAIHG